MRLHCSPLAAIASDHAPHHVNLKMLEFDRAPFGITGLETAVALALTKLQLSVVRLIELFSINPQKIMKVQPWGLFEGSNADLTLLDLNRTWIFDVNRSRSRSRNSPFHGWPMKGKAVATICSTVCRVVSSSRSKRAKTRSSLLGKC